MVVGHEANVLGHEAAVLDNLVRMLRGAVADELTEGGSLARVVRVKSADAGDVVLKVLVRYPGVVDGHDLESFRTKIQQINMVRNLPAALGSVYTEVLSEFHGESWSAYVAPFHAGADIAASLRSGAAPEDEFFPDLASVVEILSEEGYLTERSIAVSGSISEMHYDRIRRRHWLLQDLPVDLIKRDRITINGRTCRNPLALLDEISPEHLQRFDPESLYFPVHGDLNTRNILISPTSHDGRGAKSFRIIDPRGTLQPWDPMYDISKLLFSLTAWDASLRHGFTIGRNRSGTQWAVAIRGGNYRGYNLAARRFVKRLLEVRGFRRLIMDDPGWEDRLILGHAFHLLAESACRLSSWRWVARRNAKGAHPPLHLAIGHYLYATIFLEEVMGQFERHGRISQESVLRALDLVTVSDDRCR